MIKKLFVLLFISSACFAAGDVVIKQGAGGGTVTIQQSTGGGGGGSTSPGGSDTNVQFNNSGAFDGDSGFQYDSSVSSVSIAGSIITSGVLSADKPSVSAGAFANRASFSFDSSATNPEIAVRAYNVAAPVVYFRAYDYLGNLPGSLNFSIGNGASFGIAVASCTTCTANSAYVLSGNTGRHVIYGTQGPNINQPLVQFDSVGNSSFTIPVYLSTITINKQLLDGNNSAGTSGYVLTSNGSSAAPTWQAGGSSSSDYQSIGTVFDGGGEPIVVYSTSTPIIVPYDCTISSWTLVGSTGSITIDVLRTSYSTYIGTNTSIVGAGTKPFYSTNVKGQSTPLSWTSTTLSAYDVIQFAVSSVTGVTSVSIVLTLLKT